MKRFVIVGLGNFGSAVAELLHRLGHEVVAVDPDEHSVDRIARNVTRAAVGDGRQIEILERIGARNADVGVVSTGGDLAASMLATLGLRDLGVGEVYVKVVSKDHARIMEKMGVTETIFPERESGHRLATRIASRGILNYVQLGQDFGVQEMAVPNAWVGQTLRALELRANHRISIIAVHDLLRDEMIPIPDPDAPLKDSDTLLVAGTQADLEAAAALT